MTEPIATRFKDGVAWPIGRQADVDWIAAGSETGRRITAAIPPLFACYATLTNAAEGEGLPRDLGLERRQDLAFVDVLRRHSGDRPWWIGYLDTGAGDIVFWDAPKVTLYNGWRYVFVLAGPDQAGTWRPAPGARPNWKSIELPEVMFPDDRSWLVSFLWDDDWACIGGPEGLISDLLSDPILAPNARRVDTQRDATHQATGQADGPVPRDSLPHAQQRRRQPQPAWRHQRRSQRRPSSHRRLAGAPRVWEPWPSRRASPRSAAGRVP